MCKCTASLSLSELIYGYFIALPQYHIYILCSWYRSGYSCHFHADGNHLLPANTAHHLPVSDQRKVSQVHLSSTCLLHCAIWYRCWIEEQCGIWPGDHCLIWYQCWNEEQCGIRSGDHCLIWYQCWNEEQCGIRSGDHCLLWYQCWNEEQCGIRSGDHLRTGLLWECSSMNEIDTDNQVFIYPLYYYYIHYYYIHYYITISSITLYYYYYIFYYMYNTNEQLSSDVHSWQLYCCHALFL